MTNDNLITSFIQPSDRNNDNDDKLQIRTAECLNTGLFKF